MRIPTIIKTNYSTSFYLILFYYNFIACIFKKKLNIQQFYSKKIIKINSPN